MIQYINILTNNGKSLIFRNYGNSEVDRDLLSGFLSKFPEFESEKSQNDIITTQTDNFKYVHIIIDEIIILLCADLEENDADICSKIITIKIKFIERYGDILSNGTWTINRAIFREFEKDIDETILGAIKVAIIGTGGTGKTELLQLICGEEIDLEYVPTINVNITYFDGEELENHRSIVFWDFAGQSNFRSLWKSLLDSTDIALLVLDSTFENVRHSQEILKDVLVKFYKEILIIGIANHQDKPNRLTPEFCERILSQVIDPPIKVYGMITSNGVYREKMLMILKEAIKMVSSGLKPSYKLKEIEITKKPKPQKISVDRKSQRYLHKEPILTLISGPSPKRRKLNEKLIEAEANAFVDGKDLALFLGKNKKEVKAVETSYNCFPKFKKDKITEQQVLGAILRKDILILTSKYKLQTAIALIYIFGLGYISWFVWYFIPATVDFDLSSTIVYYSFEIPNLVLLIVLYILMIILDIIWVRLLFLAIYLRNYFIVLDSQGIYYKKIGKPRYISWSEMSRITANRKMDRDNFNYYNNMVIKIYTQSRRVRFTYSNYLLKEKDILYSENQYINYFGNIFKSFYYRECPFFYV
ncbi:MAG: ADP-ribosylation factor-like protein [Promethearchaeota archaeon]